jgi:hypothetical protein
MFRSSWIIIRQFSWYKTRYWIVYLIWIHIRNYININFVGNFYIWLCHKIVILVIKVRTLNHCLKCVTLVSLFGICCVDGHNNTVLEKTLCKMSLSCKDMLLSRYDTNKKWLNLQEGCSLKFLCKIQFLIFRKKWTIRGCIKSKWPLYIPLNHFMQV